jgi:O-antigen ligase
VVGRELSVDQLSISISSVVGNSEDRNLEATKQWRLNWWREIRDYTIAGPYFWEGKGYGINLAESDGFQGGNRDEPLRSPHNSHLTFLARSGVPGFILWLMLQATWAGMMFASYVRARRLKLTEWRALFAWLVCYWVGFTVAALFDVFLEGPMAGIPFWTIFGLGWGSITLFRAELRKRRNVHRFVSESVDVGTI